MFGIHLVQALRLDGVIGGILVAVKGGLVGGIRRPFRKRRRFGDYAR